MDLISHALLTRWCVDTTHATLIAGLAPDIPFYSTYPFWLAATRQLLTAFRTNEWPTAPAWMYQCHHMSHSVLVVLVCAVIIRCATGRYPRWAAAWLLHILVDIPTHSQRYWAPQFLWPIASITVDGVSWPVLTVRGWRALCIHLGKHTNAQE